MSFFFAVTKSVGDSPTQFGGLEQNIYLEISILFHIEPLLYVFIYGMAVAIFPKYIMLHCVMFRPNLFS